LISPKTYRQVALKSYQPLMEVLKRNGVMTIIFRSYANIRILLPDIINSGFNCLWACECGTEDMDYRKLRRDFGTELRLIGGIDTDALRRGKESIRKEVTEKVPQLLEQGGYAPLVDGRVREGVTYENYLYYRNLLEQVVLG
jgi:uroporphyrinogen-III decarboxylase